MTSQHLIFIPTIFLLGVLFGILLTSRRAGGLPVLLTLGLALGTFGITHLTELPIGAGAVHAMIGGPLFDQSPSSAASEVLERIELFGHEGRAAYRLETYTGDVLFPLSLLAFFLAFARFATGRLQPAAWRRLFYVLPLAWFAVDMVENGMINILILGHPTPSVVLAGMLGPVTVVKFVLLAASMFSPPLVLGLWYLRRMLARFASTGPQAWIATDE
jgi:hypothetical protein